ncbi:hypothetical protein HH310_27190 [Actinoplanes sp. TBRC 11911]|uniref:nucleotide disphospho-sugar-binding domain-containing protein n=1 Tax=Actinoplanes sp. TBRC 11911 TaxID=2729386 RepID=UPI00145D01EB|nr:nucleotide disphospho-sugar-binding domain-containing protein [Actinoplanes sp. TBRC 11911]NMO54856.1 hypothetical protein [Actinoplanes sp. TBRC 11911]
MTLVVAFLAPPTPGHVNPTLPLVRELVARGHRVRYVTGAATAARIRRTGAETIEFPLAVDDLVGGFSTTRMAEVLDVFVDRLRAVTPAIVETLRADPPDLICHNPAAVIGASVATLLGVADLRLATGFAENARVSVADRMTAHGFDPQDARLAAYERNAFLLCHDIAPPRDPAGTPTLVFIPRSFQLDGHTFDDTFTFVGPEPHRTPAARNWTPPPGGDRVLYVSAPRRPDFHRLCVNAFTGTTWHVVLPVGDRTELTAPANFEIAPRLPHRDVLRHAAAFVCQADMTELMEALVAGVPVVALPLTPEQRLNAARLAELGAGSVGELATLTPADLRELAGRLVVDRAFGRTLERDFGPHTSTGGARLAADTVERHASAGR